MVYMSLTSRCKRNRSKTARVGRHTRYKNGVGVRVSNGGSANYYSDAVYWSKGRNKTDDDGQGKQQG